MRLRSRSRARGPSRSSTLTRPTTRAPNRRRLAQLADRQPVGLGAVLDRFFAAGERLGNRPYAHAFAGEQVELLNLVLPPRLAVPFELFSARQAISPARLVRIPVRPGS